MASLELTDEQLALVSKACELLSRIYMGQLEEIAWLFGDLPEASYQELTETALLHERKKGHINP